MQLYCGMFGNIEYELNKMKADTLGDAGRELEEISNILSREISKYKRGKALLARIERDMPGASRRKKHILKNVKDRIETKLYGKVDLIRALVSKRDESYRKLIIQRESLGIREHSWIDDFFKKDDLNGIL